MDERAQHGYPQHHADARGSEQPAAPAPWPSFQSPPYGAPVQGQAPYPGPNAHAQQQASPYPPVQQHAPAPQQLPAGRQAAPQQPFPDVAPQHQAQSMQYQYAPAFVMPGTPSADGQPMSAHGGMIGLPGQQPPADAMPMLHGGAAHHGHAQQPPQHQSAPPQHGGQHGAHGMAAHHPHGAPAPQYAPHQAMHTQPHASMHGATAMDPYAQPQAWAYPTPNGLQLVQPGTQPPAVAAAAQAPGARRRMKWETIVPAAAVACLIAAIGLFISDFDRITGRDSLSTGTQAASSEQAKDTDDAASGSGDGTAEDTEAVLEEADALFVDGRFEDAANLLHPLLDVDSPDPKVVELHDRIDAAGERNTALLAQVQRQRRAGNWAGVIGTIGQLEQLRPLSPNLTQLRGSARRAMVTQRAVRRAKGLVGQGRDGDALRVIDTALKAGPSRQLSKLRSQIMQRRAAAARRSNAGSGGGGGAATSPPAAGGNRTGGSTARPPATPVNPGSRPPVPNVPNPNTSGAGAGAGAVAGGGMGANCHTHGTVTECH